jgi:hypothetical protein
MCPILLPATIGFIDEEWKTNFGMQRASSKGRRYSADIKGQTHHAHEYPMPLLIKR